jgi:hypothetical protein
MSIARARLAQLPSTFRRVPDLRQPPARKNPPECEAGEKTTVPTRNLLLTVRLNDLPPIPFCLKDRRVQPLSSNKVLQNSVPAFGY